MDELAIRKSKESIPGKRNNAKILSPEKTRSIYNLLK